MASLFTITKQKVLESFGATKVTKDEEFEKRKAKIFAFENVAKSLKKACTTFVKAAGAVGAAQNGFTEGIMQLYDPESEYRPQALKFEEVAKTGNKMIPELEEQTKGLTAKIDQYLEQFEKIRGRIKEREKQRQFFDHYSQKLEKLKDTRNKRRTAGVTEAPKDAERIFRNERKFKTSEKEFNSINDDLMREFNILISSRFEALNPIFIDIMNIEIDYFKRQSTNVDGLKNLPKQIAALQERLAKEPRPSSPKKGEKVEGEKQREEKKEKKDRKEKKEKSRDRKDSRSGSDSDSSRRRSRRDDSGDEKKKRSSKQRVRQDDSDSASGSDRGSRRGEKDRDRRDRDRDRERDREKKPRDRDRKRSSQDDFGFDPRSSGSSHTLAVRNSVSNNSNNNHMMNDDFFLNFTSAPVTSPTPALPPSSVPALPPSTTQTSSNTTSSTGFDDFGFDFPSANTNNNSSNNNGFGFSQAPPAAATQHRQNNIHNNNPNNTIGPFGLAPLPPSSGSDLLDPFAELSMGDGPASSPPNNNNSNSNNNPFGFSSHAPGGFGGSPPPPAHGGNNNPFAGGGGFGAPHPAGQQGGFGWDNMNNHSNPFFGGPPLQQQQSFGNFGGGGFPPPQQSPPQQFGNGQVPTLAPPRR